MQLHFSLGQYGDVTILLIFLHRANFSNITLFTKNFIRTFQWVICSHEPKFKGCTTKSFFLMSSSHHSFPLGGNQCYQVLMYCYKEKVLFLSQRNQLSLEYSFMLFIFFLLIFVSKDFFIDISTEYYMCLLNTVFALHRNKSEWFLFLIWKNLKSCETNCCLVPKLCPTLCDHLDCSPPGSSVHGILQARILEWVVSSFSRGSSWPRDRTCVSCIGRQILYRLSHQRSQ